MLDHSQFIVGPLVKRGDEVITSPFTFITSAEVIAAVGTKPMLVDVETDTCNLDVERLEAKISPRTRAIMAASLYGQLSDKDEINAVVARSSGNRRWRTALPPSTRAAWAPYSAADELSAIAKVIG